MKEDCLQVRDASAILNLACHTVRRYSDKGLIPSARNKRGERVFDIKDLLVFKRKIFEAESRGKRLGRETAILSIKTNNSVYSQIIEKHWAALEKLLPARGRENV